jgi:general secretion pathway protein F
MAPIYDYKALDSVGKNQKGIVEAESQKAARAKLKKQGLMITEIAEKSSLREQKSGGIQLFGPRVGAQEIANMTRQLASLVKANIPLVEALGALVDQTENERLKVILSQVRQDVNEGSSLAKSTGKHPKIFDNIFVNMIEAGESSGTLSLVLIRLADLKEGQMRLRNKVISGMTYPVLMMVVSFSLMLAIFTFVIPKLMKIFDSMNKPIPTLTQYLMAVSNSLVNGWYIWISTIAFSIWAFRRYINSATGRPKWDAFTLRLPIAGPMVRMVAVTRFSSVMATLLDSGVPILTSMNIAKNLVGNVPIAEAIASAKENITEGQSIADPLRRSGQFPPMMTHMIAIGEKTGELPEMLKSIAETYEEQVNTKIDAMTSLLEPLMIVGMGLSVGFIVLSVFMPLMEMMNLNQR